MTLHDPTPLVIDQQLSAELQWRSQERIGNDAEQLLHESQHAIEALCHVQGLTVDGWVQNAGRSVVTLAGDGQVIVKSPLFDGFNTVAAIAGYSAATTGPSTYGISIGANHQGVTTQCAVAMQRIGGNYFHTSDIPTVHEIATIVELAGTVYMAKVPLQPFFSELQDRIAIEVAEAFRRSEALGDTSSLGTIMELAEKITATQRPYRLCHGHLDARNVKHHNGQMRIIDPEPVVAPIEFDAAKISYSTGVHPDDVAAELRCDVKLVAEIHHFLSMCGSLYRRIKGRAMS